MSSQMSKAIIDQKTVLIKAVNPKGEYISYTFKATGSDVKFEGFLKVYSENTRRTVLIKFSIFVFVLLEMLR